MSKRVPMGARPKPQPAEQARPDPEAWVSERKLGPGERVKRLTVDVPMSLHQRIRVRCVKEDTTISEVVRDLLETHFPPE